MENGGCDSLCFDSILQRAGIQGGHTHRCRARSSHLPQGLVLYRHDKGNRSSAGSLRQGGPRHFARLVHREEGSSPAPDLNSPSLVFRTAASSVSCFDLVFAHGDGAPFFAICAGPHYTRPAFSHWHASHSGSSIAQNLGCAASAITGAIPPSLGTAFNCPARPVDFSVDVAPSVRR